MKKIVKKRFLLFSTLFVALVTITISFFFVKKENRVLSEQKKFFGGIVSHHLLIEEEIENFFEAFSGQNIDTVVVVGPNHFGLGNGGVLTTKESFETSYGKLNVDERVVDELTKVVDVKMDNSPFEIDHSILTLTPFIKKYLGEVKVVPIVLKMGSFEESTLSNVSEVLNKTLSADSIVIASVDFSHHLNNNMADFHDEMSLSVIGNFDFSRIKKLEVDSPASLFLVLDFLKKRGIQKMSHFSTNSAKFSGELESEDVTSYLFAHFSKGGPFFENKVSILSFGDAMFDRGVKKWMENNDIFDGIGGVEDNFLRGYDLATLNLEGPITKISKGNCQSRENVFRFSEEIGGLLFDNNIKAVNLANNHIIDCYSKGLEDTKGALVNSKVDFFVNSFGENAPLSYKMGKRKVVFMGLDSSLKGEDFEEEVYGKVRKFASTSDFLILNIHWGNEYETSYSKLQQEIAHKMIDRGVDLIIGHHPHVIQPAEEYRGKLIFYSLGNFIFDQERLDTRAGIAVGSVLGELGDSFYVFPYESYNGVPTLLDYVESQDICKRVFSEVSGNEGCYLYNSKLGGI